MGAVGAVYHAVEFRVIVDPDWPTRVEPVVDGVLLRDLVARFEHDHGYEPAGHYAGLVPDTAHAATLDAYLHGGEGAHHWARGAGTELLSCECGEPGCWPLDARVTVAGDHVTWSEFRQPHRPGWSYREMGPLLFRRAQYDVAAAEAVRQLVSDGA